MALSFDDQINFAKAILVHRRTHFPGKEIATFSPASASLFQPVRTRRERSGVQLPPNR
jgi:hypothetical protein